MVEQLVRRLEQLVESYRDSSPDFPSQLQTTRQMLKDWIAQHLQPNCQLFA